MHHFYTMLLGVSRGWGKHPNPPQELVPALSPVILAEAGMQNLVRRVETSETCREQQWDATMALPHLPPNIASVPPAVKV
jgi:hypothetical protein